MMKNEMKPKMTKEEKESRKKIERALKDEFAVVYLTEHELKRYVEIRNSLEMLFELG